MVRSLCYPHQGGAISVLSTPKCGANKWFVFYGFFCVFLPSPPNFSCYVFSVFSCLLFKLLSRPFFPLVFLWCFLFFPIINFVFFSFKSFIFVHLFYDALFRFFPVYFLPTLFFVNFILVFSFFYGQSCCFDFLTLYSFCPQNFAHSYLVVVSLCAAFCFIMWWSSCFLSQHVVSSLPSESNQTKLCKSVQISPLFCYSKPSLGLVLSSDFLGMAARW